MTDKKNKFKKEGSFLFETTRRKEPWYSDNTINVSYDWHYAVEIEYDIETHCAEIDEDPDDYCRCGTIENARVAKDVDVNKLIKTRFSKESLKKNTIGVYIYDRILRKVGLRKEDFSIKIIGGYYGEEIDGVYLKEDKLNRMREYFYTFVDMPDDMEKVRFTLNLEYGHILDCLKHENLRCYVQNVSLNDIEAYNKDYMRKIDDASMFYGEDYLLPRGILLKTGNKFRIIDGYHRVNEAKKLKLKTCPFIIVTE